MIPKEYIPLYLALGKLGFEGEHIEADFLNNIRVQQKDDMYLYNYSDIVIVPRNHPMLVKCRGLVVRKDGTILNYPFDRFFNDFESDCKSDIDWSTAVAQEKIDGSLISVFHNGKDWEITTRGSFYPKLDSGSESIDYAEEFKRLFKNFSLLDKDKCFIFELVSKKNRIVTKYDWEFVTLIGARDLGTLKEKSQNWLNEFAILIEVIRPKQVSVQNIEECKKLFEGLRPDEEGLVIVDNQFNRIKLKQESYLKMSKVKSLKDEEIFEYVKGNLEIDAEFIHSFPEVEEKINEIMLKWEEYQREFEVILNKFYPYLKVSRKEFAIRVVQYPRFRAALFAHVDGKIYKDYVKYDMLGDVDD